MSFGSFLSGIYHQINPFDNGQTYGSVNPPKKKRPDQQPQPSFRPPSAPQQSQPQITTQRPQNIFDHLLTNFNTRLPSAPNNYARPAPQPQPQQNGGFWHGLTHNPVTNVVGGVGKAVVSPFNYLIRTDIVNPIRELASGENPKTVRQSNIDLGLGKSGTDIKHGLLKWGGNSAGALLTVAAPGASKFLEGQTARFLPKAAPSVVRTVVPKAVAGSQIGGAFNVSNSVAQGDTKLKDLLKSYGLGALVGGGTEGAFPLIKKFLPNFLRRSGDTVASEEPIASSAAVSAMQPPQVRKIPVATGVDVNAPPSQPVNIPVTRTTKSGKIIREVGGDASGVTTMPTPNEIAQRRFTNQPVTRPDQAIEGVTPRPPQQPFKLSDVQVKSVQDNVVQDYAKFLKDLGEGNGVSLVPDGERYGTGYKRVSNNVRFGDTKGKRMTAQDWIDQARKDLESGKAEPGAQQAFNDAANPEVQAMMEQQPAPEGTPITVKDVKGIPVTDQTVMPTDAGTPGTVRAITQTSPMAAKSKVAAATPLANAPKLPAETQAILDNPRQFSKRQVAAARNQRKLAKQLAKTKSDTKAVIASIPELAPKPGGEPGFVPTGNYNKGVRGNVTESASKSSEAAQAAFDTSNLSVQDALANVQKDIAENGVASPQSIRNLKAMRDSGRFAKSSPEYKALNTEYNNGISNYARGLSLTDRAARANATGDQLTNRFVNKLLVFADSNKLSEQDIADITRAENAFTEARDVATSLAEQFKATGNPADFKAWRQAQQTVEKLDRQAKITEFHVSKRVLDGNKNADALKAMQEAEKTAGVYSMDAVDANMLSGTGTMFRNYVNTLFPRLENRLFGKASSLAVRKIAPVGGSSWRGARLGSQIGKQMYKADLKARKEGGIGFIRRTVTAGNTIGEKNIQATAYARGYDHYKQLLSKEGYSGAELRNRAEFMARTDPKGFVKDYEAQALQANALSSLTHSKKFENILADRTQKWLADSGFGKTGQQAGRLTAKGITRVAVGFPTVIARSLVEGLKRATLGMPEAGWAALRFAKTGDKEAFAGSLAKAMQHAGSGASLIMLGDALAKAGLISGNYPKDPAERARWKAEGRQPNSINIGGQWFQIPGYLGGFALPLMLGASSGNIQDEMSLGNTWQTILDASPVDNIQSTVDILTGNASDAKVKNAVTSLVRTGTPAGSLVAEIAKLTDSTKNDTSTKDALHNILDNIAGGIPGLNNAVNKTPATDAYGNVIKNPNRIATVFGAQGSEQSQGKQAVNKEQSAADKTFGQLKDYGVIGDKNLMQLVDPKLKAQIDSGQPLTPEDVKKVQESVVKGITASGDSNWRESGNYATDKAALQAKVQLLEADPTTKPSEIAAYKAQIARDTVLNDHNIPYKEFKLYEDTTLTEWRYMGNPKSENYDPETYKKLWAMDQLFAKAGGSDKLGDPSKQKYSAKKSGAGGSGSGSRKMGTDFGKLKRGASAPTVQKYDTIDTSPAGIPIINRVRSNIVHNITSSG